MAFHKYRGSGGGGNSIDLLWTNPNPQDAFASQTVLLDLSSYEQVIIQIESIKVVCNKTTTEFIIPCTMSINGEGAIAWGRDIISITDTGVNFGTGYRCRKQLTYWEYYNTLGVPKYIWGVKTAIPTS